MALQENDQVTWAHQDPVTKSQRLTNSAGTVISWVELDPWGAETGGSSNSQQQPHRYTSYERDTNGGDEAMLRRYEGQWQRFSQPDPFGGSYNLSDPQSFNRYAYVQNDPVNFVDPLGLDGQGTTIICFPSPSGPICISSGVGVTVTGGGGGSIAGGGGGGNGFLNLRQLMVGAGAEENGGGFSDPQNATQQNDPCFGLRPSDLNFNAKGSGGQTGLEHITERHITATNPSYQGKSKYLSGFQVSGVNMASSVSAVQRSIMELDRKTFSSGARSQASPKSNIVIVYGEPWGVAPNFKFYSITGIVGKGLPHAGQATNLNTLVLRPDCRSVVTSFPGLPSNYNGAIGGSPPYFGNPFK